MKLIKCRKYLQMIRSSLEGVGMSYQSLKYPRNYKDYYGENCTLEQFEKYQKDHALKEIQRIKSLLGTIEAQLK